MSTSGERGNAMRRVTKLANLTRSVDFETVDRARILVIEDDVVDQMAFERFVRKEGLAYDYQLASSVAEAKEVLAAESFDLIVTDYHLGDGTAMEIFQLGIDVPTVVITGAGDEEIVVKALRAGAFDYMIKDTERRYLKMLPVTIDNARRHHALDKKLHMLSQAVTSINDCMYVTDMEDRFVFVNETFRRTYGYDGEEILGQTSAILWASGCHPSSTFEDPRSLPHEGELTEGWHRKRDGGTFAVLLSRSAIFDANGQQIAVVGAVRDISERKRWEEALRESEERYALAAAGANDGLWDWDLRREEIYFSPRWKSTLGYDEGEIGNGISDWLALVHRDELDLLQAQIDAHLEGRTPHFENEHRMRAKDGEYIWVQTRGLAVRDEDGKVYRMVGSQRDVTDRKKVEEELTHAALHDSLTGLPNRALFMDRLSSAVNRSKRRESYPFGVIFLDLDRFKVINDGLGHLVGDQLLCEIALRLESCVRLGDTVARLGGDEFAILLEDLEDVTHVEAVAERIHEELKAPFNLDGHEIFSSASLGIALGSELYEGPEEILRDADTAMYRAKSLGRTRRVIFDPTMHARAVELLTLETDLRRAVDRQEFLVHYQPIVSLRSGELRGFEALVRWLHPERGLVQPGEFLPVAQETGLSVPMGYWVLHEACRQMRAWQEGHGAAAELVVSVNLDARQLSSSDFTEQVEEALASSGLAAESLQLEITEGMIIHNPQAVAKVLARLRERGIKLHIDDFGTGYSSLSQLHRFPIDTLKIDRSFVSHMSSDDEDLEIVRTIVSLAHNLALDVMAEGVETGEQLAQLRALGCEFGQGYLFSKPVSPETVEEHLAAGPWSFAAFGGAVDRHPEPGPP